MIRTLARVLGWLADRSAALACAVEASPPPSNVLAFPGSNVRLVVKAPDGAA